MQKTVLEWVNDIPQPHRNRTIDNINRFCVAEPGILNRQIVAESYKKALAGIFQINETPEGGLYWKFVFAGMFAHADAEYNARYEAALILLKEAGNLVVLWSVEDVQYRAAELEIEITDEQARIILEKVDNSHDATFGVCWSTFDEYIEKYRKPDLGNYEYNGRTYLTRDIAYVDDNIITLSTEELGQLLANDEVDDFTRKLNANVDENFYGYAPEDVLRNLNDDEFRDWIAENLG